MSDVKAPLCNVKIILKAFYEVASRHDATTWISTIVALIAVSISSQEPYANHSCRRSSGERSNAY